MSLQVENLEHNMAKVTIEVEAAKLDDAIKQAFNKKKGQFNVPGFRKGKVPFQLIAKEYGVEIFYEDAANILIPDAYAEAMKDTDLEIVSRPEIDVTQLEKGKDFIFTATFALKPEVTLGDYKGIEVPKTRVTVKKDEIEEELKKGGYKAVACIHGETSTSMMQPMEELGKICKKYDALLIVDTVATMGGVDIPVDKWGIDGCIAGTQKCISAPSGSALITYNDKISKIVNERKKVEKGIRTSSDIDGTLPQIPSNYLDIAQLEDYWSPRHLNHHTEATSMQYAVHEALRCIMLEGLQERFARHALNDKALCAGLQAMGLKIFGDLKHKMPCVTAICIPEGIDGPTLRGQALRDFGIEMATSFGPLDGKIIRIGNMGYSSQKRNILFTLGAIEAVLIDNGVKVPAGEAVAAALQVYKNA